MVAGADLQRRDSIGLMVAVCLICGPLAVAQSPQPPVWAFPGAGPPKAPHAPGPIHLPGSDLTLPAQALSDRTHAVDWRPASHPVPPEIVVHSDAPNAGACGFCHLPDGRGRPENASVSGLPVGYIVDQVAAMRTGDRKAARPDWLPSALMMNAAALAAPEDIAAAAAYFSARPFRTHVRVVEARRVRHPQEAGYLFRETSGPLEPLGLRIVEAPDSVERFELRDPDTRYTARVPPGSLVLGRRLVLTGDGGRTAACQTCHGARLTAGAQRNAPPLAGRFPGYLYRQLLAFRSGSRAGAAAAPMRAVVTSLGDRDMIAAAAYAASLKP